MAAFLRLFQNLHRLAAAPGDDLTGLDMEQLMADGTVYIAFLFGPNYSAEGAFQFVFHKITSNIGNLKLMFEAKLQTSINLFVQRFPGSSI